MFNAAVSSSESVVGMSDSETRETTDKRERRGSSSRPKAEKAWTEAPNLNTSAFGIKLEVIELPLKNDTKVPKEVYCGATASESCPVDHSSCKFPAHYYHDGSAVAYPMGTRAVVVTFSQLPKTE